MVVSNNKQSQCIHRFPSPVRFDWNFHAWKDSNIKNIINPDIPSPLMAKNPRINRNGLMPSIRHVAINILNRDSAEVDNPP